MTEAVVFTVGRMLIAWDVRSCRRLARESRFGEIGLRLFIARFCWILLPDTIESAQPAHRTAL